MKHCILIILACIFYDTLNAQEYGITGDGKYVFAVPYTSKLQSVKDCQLRASSGRWNRVIEGVENFKFCNDDKEGAYLKRGNLYILKLGTDNHKVITGVSSYNLEGKDRSVLIYRDKSGDKLSIRSLKSGRSISVPDAQNYFMSPDGSILFARIRAKNCDSLTMYGLVRVDLNSKNIKTIWTSSQESLNVYGRYSFSDDGSHLAFFTSGKDGYSVWLYKTGEATVRKLLSNSQAIEDKQYHLETRELKFAPNGRYLVFCMSSKREFPKNEFQKDIENLNSYLDPKPNFYWKQDVLRAKKHLFSIELISSKITRIEGDYDIAVGTLETLTQTPLQVSDNHALIYHFEKEAFPYYESGSVVHMRSAMHADQNRYLEPDVYLVNLNNGARKLIKSQVRVNEFFFPSYQFSRSGNEVVYYDSELGEYWVYDIKTNSHRGISGPASGTFNFGDLAVNRNALKHWYYHTPFDILWVEGEVNALLAQDRFGDVWKLFVDGVAPINLTKSYAMKNKIVFSIVKQSDKIVRGRELQLLATEVGNMSKLLGYFELSISGNYPPKKLMDFGIEYDVRDIITTKKPNRLYGWLLSNDTLPPTFYFGKSFAKRKVATTQIGAVSPVKTELLSWMDQNGEKHSGVLIFPKDFDSSKQYPVLISYYESLKVQFPFRFVDDPSFNEVTSLGYLLFYPDLNFKVGYTSSSVTNIVVTGAQQLKTRSYVNGKKIGVLGGSFGGYLTNCIIGQTDIFAAAFSVAGYSDLISMLGLEDMDSEQSVRAGSFNGQLNIGPAIWERPDLYLENSPVFYADRVTCPVLLWHGRQDYRVPFQQGMEFYKALKACGKQVWLDAPNAGHAGAIFQTVLTTKKAKQFFAHYLKGEPAPYWMTRPALELLEKGLNPYDYDPEIKTPGEGIIPKKKTVAPPIQELLDQPTTVDKNGRIVGVKN